MKKIIGLIDGDVLAYRAACIVEKRSVMVTHLPTGESKEFKTRTEFKQSQKEKHGTLDNFNEDDWKYEDIQTPENPGLAFQIMDQQIERIKDKLFASRVEIFISGSNNFRDYLPLPEKYKGNRTEMLRPIHLDICKQHLYRSYNAEISHGFESDDYLIIRGNEIIKEGDVPVLITVDKDANAYSGFCLYDFTQEIPSVISVPNDVGILYDNGKKITGLGFKFFCHQMLIGDPVDNYKPTKICGVKFGEKSSLKVLEKATTEQECLQIVIDHYKKWYPSVVEYTDWEGKLHKTDWKGLIDLYFKCVRMKSTKEDLLDFKEFASKYGVNLE